MRDIIHIRHKLHENPELAFHEYRTTEIIKEALSSFGNELIIHSPMETGLIAEYKVNDGDYLLFRADIDGLPIEEKTRLPYSSRNGNAHVCGHDVHASSLLGAVRYCLKQRIPQNILFVFQPGEEAGGGAVQLMNTGFFKRYSIQGAFAFHVSDEFELGTIASSKDLVFASSLEVNIHLLGKAAHVAFPEKGKDALKGMTFVLNKIYENGVEREGFIFGIGKAEAGRIRNIVADFGIIEGSIRSRSLEKSYEYLKELESILQLAELKQWGIQGKIELGAAYKEVKNHPVLFDKCRKLLGNVLSFQEINMRMTGEDFGYFSEKYPAFMFWLGTRKPGSPETGLHNPYFSPPDDAVVLAVKAWSMILDNYSLFVS